MPLTVNNVFGAEIGDVVQRFNSASSGSGLKTGLAPSYGALNRESIKRLDDNLKIMIGSTLKTIAAIPVDQRTWDNLMQAMMRNPLIMPANGSSGIIARETTLMRRLSYFERDNTAVREAFVWFTQLVADEDVLRNTQIDINFISKLFGENVFVAGATPYARDGLSLVDIGVMRFPDLDRPFFQMYMIKLTLGNADKSGFLFGYKVLQGSYYSTKFAPNTERMKAMTSDVHGQAVKEGESIFD